MIVRISGVGQYRVADDLESRLNDLDNDAVKAVESGDEASCQAAGINVTFYKIASLMISAAFAGLGGVLYAHYQLQVGPDALGIGWAYLPLSQRGIAVQIGVHDLTPETHHISIRP